MLSEAERDVWEGPKDVKAEGLPTLGAGHRSKRISGGAVALVAVGVAALGCGGAQGAGGTPQATLAATSDVQTAFRPLLKRWTRGSNVERAKLEPDLYAFAKAHPRDPVERLAEALLAWIALDRGDLGRAETLARRAAGGAAGNTRNVALVVVGAALRRRGDPRSALLVLRPLVSKLIDPWARALLNDEAVAAALAARDWTGAIGFMEIAVREAGEDDRSTARAAVAARISGVPDEDLISLLEHRHSGGDAEELQVPTLAAQHLAMLVQQRKDVALARRLLAVGGPLLGDQGDSVAKLAQGGGAARVDARTVGLLLSIRDDESRRRGAEVVAGLAMGLGLPGSGARLATREDGAAGGAAQALDGLAADGAAVIVAGVNVEQAKLAAEFADRHRIPVILLRPPELGSGSGSRFAFVLGDDPARTADLLQAALAGRGVGLSVTIGEADELQSHVHASNESPSLPCGSQLPFGVWKAAGVGGLVLGGGFACVEDALATLEHAPLRLSVAVGLSGGSIKASPSGIVATAGRFPVDAETSVASIRDWITRRGDVPTWWAGLGHDAGVLAWDGVRALPAQGTEDPKEVAARREAATEALANASAELWTTEARGFEGGRMVPRRVSVRER